MFSRLLVTTLLVLSCAGAVQAQTPAVGTKIGSSIDLGVRTVPLPEGVWTVVSTGSGQSTKQNALLRVYLAQLEGGRLSRWLYIGTNVDVKQGGWGRNKDICDRKNVHFAHKRFDSSLCNERLGDAGFSRLALEIEFSVCTS